MKYDLVSAVENFVSRLEMPVDYLEAVKEDYDKSDKGGKGKFAKGQDAESGKGKPQINKVETEATGKQERELQKQAQMQQNQRMSLESSWKSSKRR